MISNLPKWYRLVAIDAFNEETLQKRSAAIQSIANSGDTDFFLDCIRFYLSKPVKRREFSADLFKLFNSADPMFLDDASDLEKRVLCGAILSEVVKRKDSKSLIVASLLRSAVFGVTQESIINIDIIQEAINYLEEQAGEARKIVDPKLSLSKHPVFKGDQQSIDTLASHVKALGLYVKDLSTNMEKQNSAFIDRLAVLEEESNIHWWLFRSFSKLKQVPISQLNIVEAPFILALELESLYTHVPFPDNSQAFLNKMLMEVPNWEESISIEQAAATLTGTLNKYIQQYDEDRFGNLTPLFFACSKSRESDGDELWKANFTKLSGLSSKFSCSPLDISNQFISEVLSYEL